MAKRKPKLFEEIVLKEFKIPKEKVSVPDRILTEAYLPLTPFIAYASLRKSVFNALKKNKFVDMAKVVKTTPTKVKAKAKTEIEKLRAGLGANSGETVYKLTQEQTDVMSDIYDKYGKELVDEILEFRRKILAPYQVIKRTIKQSNKISSKDITGMSKEEFESALESGRKKIQARGNEFFSKSENIQDAIADINTKIQDLRKARKEFSGENPKINYNIVNRINKAYNISDESYEGYTKEELEKVYNEIMKNYKSLLTISQSESLSPEEWDKAKSIMDRNRKLWSGKTIDLTKNERGEFFQRGNFNEALGKYFFSRKIIEQLTKPGVVNIFKKTYISIIDEMIKKAVEKKSKLVSNISQMKKTVEFTDKEKLIWGELTTAKKFSGNLNDYYQKIKKSYFLDQPIYIPRSEKLIAAEKKIENEIRKFERRLKSILDEDDFNRLKRYRLINNLITTKELRDPENMFKSKSDLVKDVGEKSVEADTGKEYFSPVEYRRRLKEIATIEYDTVAELNGAKKTAEMLTKRMLKQGDTDAVEENRDILRQIKLRRDIGKRELVGHAVEPEGIIGIDDVEKLAKKILNKEYHKVDVLKQDKSRLSKIIEKYKNTSKNAEENLDEIKFLLDRVNRKLTTEKSNLT